MRVNISDSVKKRIAGRQLFKCANEPNSNLRGLEGYKCALWSKKGDDKGSFDESGYEIDHIVEYSVTQDNSAKNLQALCVGCHRVKTSRFMTKRAQDKKPSDVGPKYSKKKLEISKNGKCGVYEFEYLIRYNQENIGDFTILYDSGFNTELALNTVRILPIYNNDTFIELLVSAITKYCDVNYHTTKSYVFNCGKINFVTAERPIIISVLESSEEDDTLKSEEEISNAEYKQIKKTFMDKILINKKYLCYPLHNSMHVIMYKPSINKLKQNSRCEVLLSFDDKISFHYGHENDVAGYQKNDEILACKRNFDVIRKRCKEKGARIAHNRIEITFDRPLVFYSKTGFLEDVEMKFIANGRDYTPGDGFEYRLNKLMSKLGDPLYVGSYDIGSCIYVIDGFSYFETVKDCEILCGRCHYPQLCKMMRDIYEEHRIVR